MSRRPAAAAKPKTGPAAAGSGSIYGDAITLKPGVVLLPACPPASTPAPPAATGVLLDGVGAARASFE